MQITFLLPALSQNIVGGFKVIYEYANRFTEEGHNVCIAYISCHRWGTRSIPIRIIHWSLFTVKKMFKIGQHVKWMTLHNNVKEFPVLRLTGKNLPKADVYIATWVDTAYDLAELEQSNIQNSFYLVQGFESWVKGGEDYVFKSYNLSLNKIAVSYFIQKKINLCGENAEVVTNGIEQNVFFIKKNIKDRDRLSIALLYHKASLKGFSDSLEAVLQVRKVFPGITLRVFGSYKRPKGIPSWAEYYYRPDRQMLCNIYNDSAIFVSASKSEGFGLTPAEAMACGCAVACTDIGGFNMFAVHEETALLSPTGNTTALAENILRLVKDDGLRNRIAAQGNRIIKDFTWDNAYCHLKEYILRVLSQEKGI